LKGQRVVEGTIKAIVRLGFSRLKEEPFSQFQVTRYIHWNPWTSKCS